MSRHQDIRAAAAALRALAEDAPTPLDLAALAERAYGLSVFDDASLDPAILGEYSPLYQTIRLRPRLAAARRRFVIAHELGHAALEGDARERYADDDATLDDLGEPLDADAQLYNTRDRHERDANLFALELLLPALDLAAALAEPGWDEAASAARHGVSVALIRAQIINIWTVPTAASAPLTGEPRAATPDADQRAAVDAPLPTLVVAGPGTGKTASIVAKYLALVDADTDPASILALTFSVRAADELRQRIAAALAASHPSLAGRAEVSTYHAWALNALRGYGHLLGAAPELRLATPGEVYLLLRQQIVALPLDQYRSLRAPGQFLGQLIAAVSRIKDQLIDPAAFAARAERQAERRIADAERDFAGKTTKKAQKGRDDAARDAARLRELAAFYAAYQQILARERTLDYGDLIAMTVALLRMPEAEPLRQRYGAILLDEFQDINLATGEMVRLLDGGRGLVWAVGDPWQSIYRFRGASPANLAEFPGVYPGASARALSQNYRSGQAILDATAAAMTADPLAPERPPLTASRQHGGAVIELVAAGDEAMCAAIARDIIGHTRSRRRWLLLRALRAGGAWRRSATPRKAMLRRPVLRPAALASFAVLCRTRAHAGQVAAALSAHGIAADWAGDLFSEPAVQDALAILALVPAADAADANNAWDASPGALLRAIQLAPHAVAPADLDALVRQAHAHGISLRAASGHAESLAALSEAGRAAIAAIAAQCASLAAEPDAYAALMRYLLRDAPWVRSLAAAQDRSARRSLAALGQLAQLARGYVRAARDARPTPAAFVAHVRLLIESGETPRLPPDESLDAVRLLTIHGAKGLEFATVYLPFLQKGQFPPRARSGSVPDLPLDETPLGDDALREERYLLYVAMTRARDRLVLLRSDRGGGKSVERSPLLPQLAWPLCRIGSGWSLLASAPEPPPATPVVRRPVPAASLETYERCPRRYLYQYGYQLLADADPYLRVYQAASALTRRLETMARAGDLPQDAAALTALTAEVAADFALETLDYGDAYRAEVAAQGEAVWQSLRGESGARPSAATLVERPMGAVALRVDLVEPGERWVRLRVGEPRDDDHLSTRVMLYAMAQRQRGVAGTIALRYPSSGEEREVEIAAAVLERHTAALDRLLEAMAAGRWEPEPGPACAHCPFVLICPQTS